MFENLRYVNLYKQINFEGTIIIYKLKRTSKLEDELKCLEYKDQIKAYKKFKDEIETFRAIMAK